MRRADRFPEVESRKCKSKIPSSGSKQNESFGCSRHLLRLCDEYLDFYRDFDSVRGELQGFRYLWGYHQRRDTSNARDIVLAVFNNFHIAFPSKASVPLMIVRGNLTPHFSSNASVNVVCDNPKISWATSLPSQVNDSFPTTRCPSRSTTYSAKGNLKFGMFSTDKFRCRFEEESSRRAYLQARGRCISSHRAHELCLFHATSLRRTTIRCRLRC
jgi:hypothetical protein